MIGEAGKSRLILEALAVLLEKESTEEDKDKVISKIYEVLHPKEKSLPNKTEDALSEEKCDNCGHSESWHFESSRTGLGCNIPNPKCNCELFAKRDKSE